MWGRTGSTPRPSAVLRVAARSGLAHGCRECGLVTACLSGELADVAGFCRDRPADRADVGHAAASDRHPARDDPGAGPDCRWRPQHHQAQRHGLHGAQHSARQRAHLAVRVALCAVGLSVVLQRRGAAVPRLDRRAACGHTPRRRAALAWAPRLRYCGIERAILPAVSEPECPEPSPGYEPGEPVGLRRRAPRCDRARGATMPHRVPARATASSRYR